MAVSFIFLIVYLTGSGSISAGFYRKWWQSPEVDGFHEGANVCFAAARVGTRGADETITEGLFVVYPVVYPVTYLATYLVTYRPHSALRLLRNCTMLPIIASDKNAP